MFASPNTLQQFPRTRLRHNFLFDFNSLRVENQVPGFPHFVHVRGRADDGQGGGLVHQVFRSADAHLFHGAVKKAVTEGLPRSVVHHVGKQRRAPARRRQRRVDGFERLEVRLFQDFWGQVPSDRRPNRGFFESLNRRSGVRVPVRGHGENPLHRARARAAAVRASFLSDFPVQIRGGKRVPQQIQRRAIGVLVINRFVRRGAVVGLLRDGDESP
mmetsp:Transcript_9137/g.30451  ORF Transcript_9137/g.30451 Transcript_9137/m.30451 type:complete len:215 (+) Transcript_9137:134-778(+)